MEGQRRQEQLRVPSLAGEGDGVAASASAPVRSRQLDQPAEAAGPGPPPDAANRPARRPGTARCRRRRNPSGPGYSPASELDLEPPLVDHRPEPLGHPAASAWSQTPGPGRRGWPACRRGSRRRPRPRAGWPAGRRRPTAPGPRSPGVPAVHPGDADHAEHPRLLARQPEGLGHGQRLPPGLDRLDVLGAPDEGGYSARRGPRP